MSRLCFVRFFHFNINFSSKSDFILVLLSAFKRVDMSGPMSKHNSYIERMTSVCVPLRKTWGSVHVPAVLVPVTLWGVWCRAGCPSEWRSWMRLEPVWRCETMSECFSGWTPRPSPAFDCHLAGTWPQGCFRIPPGRDIFHPRHVCIVSIVTPLAAVSMVEASSHCWDSMWLKVNQRG